MRHGYGRIIVSIRSGLLIQRKPMQHDTWHRSKHLGVVLDSQLPHGSADNFASKFMFFEVRYLQQPAYIRTKRITLNRPVKPVRSGIHSSRRFLSTCVAVSLSDVLPHRKLPWGLKVSCTRDRSSLLACCLLATRTLRLTLHQFSRSCS